MNNRIGKIGASDAGALMGYNPWSSPANQTAIILGLIEIEQNVRMDFGKRVQPIIADMVMERTGLYAMEHERTIYHPQFDWMQATPDYEIGELAGDLKPGPIFKGNPIPLELKYVGEYVSDHWGQDGDPNGVPPYVALQCIQQANILGKNKVMVAALIGGRDLRIYELELEERDIKALETATVNFYEKWIVPKLIPPLDHRDVETMKKLYPVSVPKILKAPDSFVTDHIGPYVHAKENIEEWEQKADQAKANIQQYMGENDTLINEQGEKLFTWKKGKDGTKTDWQGMANAMGEEFNAEDWNKYLTDHTTPKIGSRSFLTKDGAKGVK